MRVFCLLILVRLSALSSPDKTATPRARSELFRLRRALMTSDSRTDATRELKKKPRRAALAQATAGREFPAGRGTPCAAGDRRLARRFRGPLLADNLWRASTRRKAGGTAGCTCVLLRARSALRAQRACVLRAPARFARLRVPRARVLRALARFALLRLRRSCAHFYLARVPRVSRLTWRTLCALTRRTACVPTHLVVSDLCTRLGNSEPNHRLSAV